MLKNLVSAVVTLIAAELVLYIAVLTLLPIGLGSIYEDATQLPIFMVSSFLAGGVVAILQVNRMEVRSHWVAVGCAILGLVGWVSLGLSFEFDLWIYFLGCAASSYAGVMLVDSIDFYSRGQNLRVSVLLVGVAVLLIAYAGVHRANSQALAATSQLRNQYADVVSNLSRSNAWMLSRYVASKRPRLVVTSLCSSLLPLVDSERNWNSLPTHEQRDLLPALDICWGHSNYGTTNTCESDDLGDYLACCKERSKERIRNGERYPDHIDRT